MSDYRRSTISRQFTDTEAALDDRVTSHLNAPAIELRTGDSVGQSYKWLREDLELRSKLTQQLAGESMMAREQGDMYERERQFNETAQDEAEATAAYQEASALRASGKSWNDSVGELAARNPHLMANESFKTMLDNSAEFNKTDAEKEAKESAFKATVVTNRLATLHNEDRLSFLESPEGEAYRSEILKAANEKELRGIKLSPIEDEARLMDSSAKLTEAKTRFESLQKLDPGLKGRAVLAAHAADNAVPITNTQSASDYLRGNEDVGGMFLHPTFLSQQAPEDKVALGQALDKIGSKAATEEERVAAQSVIDLMTGRYMVQTAAAATFKENRKTLMEFGMDTGKSLDALNKELTDIAGRTLGKEKKLNPDNGREAVNAAEAWMKKFVVTNPAAEGLYQQYEERIEKARGLDSPKAAEAARWAAFDFAKEAMTLMSGQTAGAPPKASAGPVAISTPEEFAKLKSGDKFTFNGKPGIKP